MQAFLARQRYSGGKPASELLSKLRSAPEGRAGEAEMSSRRQVVLALVATLTPLVAQIRELERQIATAVRAHPDGEIFRSLFKSPQSTITAATTLAEMGDCRARYPSRDTLAGDAGQAAVAIESGKREAACLRWAPNKRLPTRSPRSPTPPATGTRGRPTTTPPREPAATTTNARPAPSAAPGAGSYGAAGTTVCLTTPPNTAPSNSTARSRSPRPRRRAPGPTSPPPSGCSATPSPTWRHAGPSAKRSTASRHPLSRYGA